jgi:maleylpyruvate isomerase
VKLYSYFRSSASFRVRIALNWKGLAHETVAVHLLRAGGEQLAAGYLQANPAGLVPALEHDGTVLTQSLAIIEYLEETHPDPPLLPPDPASRAFVRSIALSVACEIHPLNNLRVLRYLVRELKIDEAAKTAWYRHWVESGLEQVERTLALRGVSGDFCFGDRVTLADLFLVPQIFNARRFDCRLDHVPVLTAIAQRCMTLDAFIRAQPSAQPDAEAD